MTFLIWGQMSKLTSYRNVRKKDGYARTSCTSATQGTYLSTSPSSKRTHYESGATRISPHGSRPPGLLRPSEGAPLFAQVLQIPPSFTLSAISRFIYCLPPPHPPTRRDNPSTPSISKLLPPDVAAPHPTHPPITEPHNMDRDPCYLG